MTARIFGEGARVAMIGDSITHSGLHPSYIQEYYHTHLPSRRVKIYNLGTGGDTAEWSLSRFDEVLSVEPTEAVVMFGTNDIRYQLYTEHPTEAELAEREDRCRRHAEATAELVRRLTERGIAVTLASAVGRDELSPPTATDASLRSYGATRRLAELFRADCAALADRLVGTVDYLTPFQALQGSLVAVGGPSLFTIDRIHPSPLGQQMMARIFLRAQGLPVTLPTAEQLRFGWVEAPLSPKLAERRGAEINIRTLRWVYPHQSASTEGLDLEGRIAHWREVLEEKSGLAAYEWARVMYRYYLENAHREDEIEREYFEKTDALYE